MFEEYPVRGIDALAAVVLRSTSTAGTLKNDVSDMLLRTGPAPRWNWSPWALSGPLIAVVVLGLACVLALVATLGALRDRRPRPR